MKKGWTMLLLSAAATLALSATAGAAVITGVVRDIVTKTPISGAVVTDGYLTASTDTNGVYFIQEGNTGNFTLTVTKSSYLKTNQTCTVASLTGTTTVNWSLTKTYGSQAVPAKNMNYVIFAWNDLGMHCDQDDYSYFCVLPPFNTLRAQVIRRDGPDMITGNITVSYSFPKKTNSTLHTNFWQYAAQYGWNVPNNVGITGTPLAGQMKLDAKGLGFIAEGIPITPYDDDGTWDPYGTAMITVKDQAGNVLQTANVVAPVSTEMMCSNCHGTTNPQLDILQKHDARSGTALVADQVKGVVHRCSECHADNALGAPGVAGVESLSLAMHNFHKDKMQATPAAAAMKNGCYNCHPGPKTDCMRGIMARAGKTCTDCHGDMNKMTASLQNGRRDWLDMPKCGDCHGARYQENSNTLYRLSIMQNSTVGDMNGKFYCEACHNSTHAEHISSNPADASIPMKFQGDNYWIWNCTVCHMEQYNNGQTIHR